jgi:UDP-glucose 4-epimerase
MEMTGEEKRKTGKSKPRRRALVTGGAGFIGSHLTEKLLERGEEVWVLDDLSTGRFDNIAHLEDNGRFHYQIDTVLDYGVVCSLVDKVDVVFHLAAAVGVEYVIDHPLEALEINIVGTENVLKAANKDKKKVAVFSTSEIYGKANSVPFKETDDRVLGSTYITRWGYSASKAVDEFLALAYWREKKLPVLIVRCFNTCGPRQTGRYGMVVPRFIRQALLDHPIEIYGDGKQSRCFTHVMDVVDGVIALSDNDKAVGEIFNIGSEEEITIEELAKKIKAMTRSKSAIEYVPYEKAYEEGFEDMRRRVPDLTKIKNLIGYKNSVTLHELLKLTIADFQK